MVKLYPETKMQTHACGHSYMHKWLFTHAGCTTVIKAPFSITPTNKHTFTCAHFACEDVCLHLLSVRTSSMYRSQLHPHDHTHTITCAHFACEDGCCTCWVHDRHRCPRKQVPLGTSCRQYLRPPRCECACACVCVFHLSR